MKMKLIALNVILLITLVSCGKKKLEETRPPYDLAELSAIPYGVENVLVGDIDSLSIKRVGETRTIMADSANARLGTLAEEYLKYQMVGVTATKYVVDNQTVYLEVAQFADNAAAYGFYARTRPDGCVLIRLGTECYRTGNSIYLARGEFMVTASTDEDSEAARNAAQKLVAEVDTAIGGDRAAPRYLILFPFSGKVYPSDHYDPYQFLGIPGVHEIYSTKYGFDGDTLVLFIGLDDDSDKFHRIEQYGESLSGSVERPQGMHLPPDSVAVFGDADSKVIVVGKVRRMVVGAVGYKPEKHERLVSNWFRGLNQ